jgi:hypothetical protein
VRVAGGAGVPTDHPLRAMREIVRSVLSELHGDFAKLYSDEGRLDSQTKCDTGYVRDRHGNEKVQPPYA